MTITTHRAIIKPPMAPATAPITVGVVGDADWEFTPKPQEYVIVKLFYKGVCCVIAVYFVVVLFICTLYIAFLKILIYYILFITTLSGLL